VALDELHPEPRPVGDRAQERRRPRAGRAFEHDVTARRERGGEDFRLAAQADDALVDPRQKGPPVKVG
jgi:hypothetical protein